VADAITERCGACVGDDHQWIENPDYGSAQDTPGAPCDAMFICLHCPAIGDTCPACDGTIWHEGDEVCCTACDGSGVIERKPGGV
jgi:hypothetical protein